MRRLLFALLVALLTAPFAHAADDTETTAYRPRVFRLAFASYANRRACFLFGNLNAAPQGPDPTTIALLQRIADQQQAMALQMQLQAQQSRPVQTDPALLTTLAQIAAQQERIISAINDGKIQDAACQGLLREMINGQQQLLIAIQTRPGTPAPMPPIVVTPAPSPTPIVITPPAGGGVPVPGGPLSPLPPAGAIQAIPGVGGSLQLIPPAGGSIQALPGPGGSLQILPGGVTPPGGKPPVGPATPLPGGGILIPLPEGTPLSPMPGAGGNLPGIIPVQKPLKPIRYAIYYPPSRP